MSHTVYKQIVGLSESQRNMLRWKIKFARDTSSQDPRLATGFYFYGKYFHNYACVERYKSDTNTLDVRIFVGTKGSSYIEYDWDAAAYLDGYTDSSYYPCGLEDDYEPSVPTREFHDHCPITTPVK